MPTPTPGLAVLCAAALTSLAAIPPITRLARHKRLLDFPDGVRRAHGTAVPRLGGIAVFIGLLAAFAVGSFATGGAPSPHFSALALSLLAASAILFVVGLFDDLRGVNPLHKLIAQSAAALIVYAAGFHIDVLLLPPHFSIALGRLALPVTVLWLVGLSNAFNLVDGMDGLAAGVGVIALVVAAAAAAILGNDTTIVYSFALMGALLGFLRYNIAPARIFLGDCGSLVVGFLLGVLTVKGATRAGAGLHVLAPIFALSYPLLDTGIAMLRRWLRGEPLSRADGRHIHHQLQALGLSPRKAAAVVYAQSLGVALLGLCVTFAPPALTVAITVAGGALLVFLFVYGVRWLEYHEFLDAGAIMASSASLARRTIRDTITAGDVARIIVRAESLKHIDAILTDSAPTFRFAHMEVAPAHAHAPARLVESNGVPGLWKFEYPVVLEGDDEPDFGPEREMLVLAIWCGTNSAERPASVERIARVLAAAIATWQRGASDSVMRDLRFRARTPAFSWAAVPEQPLDDWAPGVAAQRVDRVRAPSIVA